MKHPHISDQSLAHRMTVAFAEALHLGLHHGPAAREVPPATDWNDWHHYPEGGRK